MAIKKDPREGNAGRSGKRSGDDKPAKRTGKTDGTRPKSRPYKDDSSDEKKSIGRGRKKEGEYVKFRREGLKKDRNAAGPEKRSSRSKSRDEGSSEERKSYGRGRTKDGDFSKFSRDKRKPVFGRGPARPPREDKERTGTKRPIKSCQESEKAR